MLLTGSVWAPWYLYCVFIAKPRRVYVLWCSASIISVFVFASLELVDFKPIWSTFDGHSLWHGAGPLVCYQFFLNFNNIQISSLFGKFIASDIQWWSKHRTATGKVL